MSERTDEQGALRVSRSGVVHLSGCPRLRNNNAHTLAWTMRLSTDRACSYCNPDLSTRPTPTSGYLA